ncbi:cytochrome C [Pseudorhodoferax sp. Leaf274]|nr:cytochrome C [Pseudorhodoferax sp. Leaf274]
MLWTAPAAWLLAGAAWSQGAPAAASVDMGKRLFMRCAACHEAKAGGPAKMGPHLQDLIGRPAGGLPNYGYSAAMKSKKFVWDEAQLHAWLARPTAVVPGTTMAFMGMPDAAERQALIDYMRTLK